MQRILCGGPGRLAPDVLTSALPNGARAQGGISGLAPRTCQAVGVLEYVAEEET